MKKQRKCENCEWWKGRDIHNRYGSTIDVVKRLCQRLPQWELTIAEHVCGEFKEKQ